MELKTKRLRILPLTTEQMALLCGGQEKLEAALGLSPSRARQDEHRKAAFEEMHRLCLEHPDDYIWYTDWLIILIDENKPIGHMEFKGTVNEKHEAEIGFTIDEAYRNRGYAAEAAGKLCEWAFSKNAYYIRAQTEPENEPAKKVLAKCGFKQLGESEKGLLYELEKPATAWMSIYMCLGMGAGLSIGLSLGSMAVGMCIGLAAGMALGAALDADDKKKRARD